MIWHLPCSLFSFFTLILLKSSLTAAQNGAKITVGQSLLATSTNSAAWLSPSGNFAFGFHQYPKTNNLFLLAIWYAKIPDTIVWYANNGNPVPQKSSVNITVTKGLVLSDPQGTHLWNTTNDLSGGGDVTYGFMNDNGNFVLLSSNTEAAVWQSFDYPTDTLLPTQIMKAGGLVDSRRSANNFTKGWFQLRLLHSGNLVLYTRNLPPGHSYASYYESGTNDLKNAVDKLVYSESGELYIHRNNGSRYNLKPAHKFFSAKDNYQRLSLSFDGVLTWYYHPRTFTNDKDPNWSEIQSFPDNICTTMESFAGDLESGACEYNSICYVGEDKRPKCQCSTGYSLLDLNDERGSCKQTFKQGDCDYQGMDAVKDEFKFVSLKNTDWLFSDYQGLDPCSDEECKSSYLKNCFSAVAIFHDQTSWKKKLPHSNGRQDFQVMTIGALKVGNNNITDSILNPVIPPKKVKCKTNHAVTILLRGSVCVNFLLLTVMVLGIIFKYNKKQSRLTLIDKHQRRKTLSEYSCVHGFTYKELHDATDGFKEEIGQGAFGTVYKGMIEAGGPPVIIAAKKLHRISKEADKEFKAEVNVIGQTYHKNLVRFIGFCKEGDERLLVYEYMSNGTVADYLFSDLRPSWTARMQIAQGIATGLLYLHEECSTQRIHCDIKPQNILLDDYFNARISDFGLSKLLVMNQTHTETAVRGTKGYLAPEWFRNKPVTVKVDVYSFGVLLLEIICCRRCVCMDISDEAAILTDWAFDCYKSNNLGTLVNGDMDALSDMQGLERFTMVALWCIQEDPNQRPTMKRVTQMLEGITKVTSPPCPTSFSIATQS
ncbi:unnamed protein product [Amaranthus hypochondriacus]